MFNMFVVALVPFKLHCYLFCSQHRYVKTGSEFTWPNFAKPWYRVYSTEWHQTDVIWAQSFKCTHTISDTMQQQTSNSQITLDTAQCRNKITRQRA